MPGHRTPATTAATDGSSISRRELEDRLRRDEDLVVVETGSPRSYRSGHLPGAKHLPPGRVRERAPDLLPDRDADIVVYSGDGSSVSARTADILRRMGYSDVQVCRQPGKRPDRA